MTASTRPSALRAQDIARTGCKDAQCLKRYAESLSGSCAELLLRPSLKPVPEPSPAPMPSHRGYGAAADLVSALLGQHEPKKAGRYPTASIGDDPHYLQNLHTRRVADADEGQGFCEAPLCSVSASFTMYSDRSELVCGRGAGESILKPLP